MNPSELSRRRFLKTALAGSAIGPLVAQAQDTPAIKPGQVAEPGRDVPLLKSYKLAPVELYAVFPAGPRPSTKVRALVDFLAEVLR